MLHCFQSVARVCVGISISNFICMLFVAMGQSLFVWKYVGFTMAAWRQYPLPYLSLVWISSPNFISKSLMQMIKIYWCQFQNGCLLALLDSFCVWALNLRFWISSPNFSSTLLVYMTKGHLLLSKWPPASHIGFFDFWNVTFSWALNIKSKLQ